MNVWECDHPGCKAECIGVGGAIGLRAIGWYFTYAGPILCPRHRPDPVPCHDRYTPEKSHGRSCELCAGEDEARRWQGQIAAEVGGFPQEVLS